MTEKKILVLALGHRALGTTLPEQKRATREAARAVADLAEAGYEIAITHSNSDQIGMIHTAMNELPLHHEGYTSVPLSVCSAMSQGYIGYDLQNAIRAELIIRGLAKGVVTTLTQVVVDPYDEAFYEPTKVIGRVLNAEEAEAEEAKGNFVTACEGGFRRIAASPKPVDIVEIEAVRALLEAGQIVICAGGGGIPVMEQGVDLRGASAIIEKDMAASLLAKKLDADVLMMLTNVDNVSLNFRRDNEKLLGQISVQEAENYCREDQFEQGSMLPKLEAGIDFVSEKPARRAVITSLFRAGAALKGKAGTVITG